MLMPNNESLPLRVQRWGCTAESARKDHSDGSVPIPAILQMAELTKVNEMPTTEVILQRWDRYPYVFDRWAVFTNPFTAVYCVCSDYERAESPSK